MIRTVAKPASTAPDAAPDPQAATPIPLAMERTARVAKASEQLNGATRLLRCASTGRLVRQGISMTHVHVLWLLEEHGELPMSRLAEMVDVSFSNASGLIDRMEERGLVERTRVPDDRRVVQVRIAPAGRAALDEVQIIKDDLAVAILERLSDRQLERLSASLRDFRAAIRAEADAHPGLFETRHRHDQEGEATRS